MNSRYTDFTGSAYAVGGADLLQQSISFDRCAHIVANAFLNGLIKSGLPVEQAYNVYTSKAFRHKLDWDLESNLERVAHKAGKQVGAEYQKLYRNNTEQYQWMNAELDVATQQEIENRLAHA